MDHVGAAHANMLHTPAAEAHQLNCCGSGSSFWAVQGRVAAENSSLGRRSCSPRAGRQVSPSVCVCWPWKCCPLCMETVQTCISGDMRGHAVAPVSLAGQHPAPSLDIRVQCCSWQIGFSAASCLIGRRSWGQRSGCSWGAEGGWCPWYLQEGTGSSCSQGPGSWTGTVVQPLVFVRWWMSNLPSRGGGREGFPAWQTGWEIMIPFLWLLQLFLKILFKRRKVPSFLSAPGIFQNSLYCEPGTETLL